MRTKPETTHRHYDSRSQWTKKTEAHTHEIDLTTMTSDDAKLLASKLGLSTTTSNLPPAPSRPVAVVGNHSVSLTW